MSKEDKALFIATGAFGVTVIVSFLIPTYPWLFAPIAPLFFWTGWRIKLLWIYIKLAKEGKL